MKTRKKFCSNDWNSLIFFLIRKEVPQILLPGPVRSITEPLVWNLSWIWSVGKQKYSSQSEIWLALHLKRQGDQDWSVATIVLGSDSAQQCSIASSRQQCQQSQHIPTPPVRQSHSPTGLALLAQSGGGHANRYPACSQHFKCGDRNPGKYERSCYQYQDGVCRTNKTAGGRQ